MILFVFFLFLLCSFFSIILIGSKFKTLILVSILTLFIIIAGFRGVGVDRDYMEYARAFTLMDFSYSIEISFILIVSIIKIIFGEQVVFLFLIYAFLGVYLKYKGIKDLTALVFLTLMVYTSHFYLLHEMTQIRVGVAAGFFLLCIKPIYERDLKKFLFFGFSALFFHYSALLIFPLWFLNGKKASRLFLYSIVPIGLLIYILNINLILEIPVPYIQRKMDIYKEAQEIGLFGLDKINVWNVFFIIKTLVYFLLVYKADTIAVQNKYIYLLLKISAISLFSLPAFAVIPAFAFRISELYGVVDIILFPFLIYIFDRKVIGISLVMGLSIFFLCINLFYNRIIL